MRNGRDGVFVSAMIHISLVSEAHAYLHRFYPMQIF
jgi:hypothetical protein